MNKILTKKSFISSSVLLSLISQVGIMNTFNASAGTFQSVCDELTMIEFKKKYPELRFPHLTDKKKKKKSPECTMEISLNSERITNKYVTIPTSRVTSWSVNGESVSDTGGKVVATIAFGVIGLLAANPKKHDYTLLINGYDLEGEKAFIQMKFKDGKQPPKLITELSMLTGLGMGQKRSIKEIKKIEKEEKYNIFNGEGENNYPETLY